jgi:hypothetical protein
MQILLAGPRAANPAMAKVVEFALADMTWIKACRERALSGLW